jgi:hypothetical protein
MRIVSWPATGELDLTATAAELTRLADVVEAGGGSLSCTSEPSELSEPSEPSEPSECDALTAVEVTGTTGSGVRIDVDTSREVLLISGGPAARAILAHNIRGMAEMDDGGHLHLEYFPDHFYLAAGSLPLVINSPHGGMPARRLR